jgi:hypothetical protein
MMCSKMISLSSLLSMTEIYVKMNKDIEYIQK